MRTLLVVVSLFSLACGGLATSEPTLDELLGTPPPSEGDEPFQPRRGQWGEPLEPLPGMVALATPLADVPDEILPVKGPDDNSFRVVQYSDWRCPHCLNALPTAGMGALQTQSTLVWRNFPLSGPCNPSITDVREDRCVLAAASICAQRLGKAPEFVDATLESADGVVDTFSEDPAFKSCLGDPDVAASVRQQASSGADLGILGTPTFYVRIAGTWYDVPQGLQDLQVLYGATP